MSTQPVSPPSAPPSLPDVNAQITPYDIVQTMLDQTANFSMFAVPVAGYSDKATLSPNNPSDWFGLNGGYGLDLLSNIHRFEAIAQVRSGSVRTSQEVGQQTGKFHSLCLFTTDDFKWNPKQVPPPHIFDPWRRQRFVIQECEITFGDRQTCQCYGVGRTFPIMANGRHVLLAAGVANVMKGTGKFEGREGTLIFAGTLTRQLGFLGNINLRIRDAEETIVSKNDLPPIETIQDPDRENTFIELRLLKHDKNVKTHFGPPPGGSQVSLVTPSEMRAVRYSCIGAPRGPRTSMETGALLGPMSATVFFDLGAPPGTAESPVPFTTDELYTFNTPKGEEVGTVSCGVVEGISFGLKFPQAPRQPGVRFAGFGPITGGTGVFAGAQGILTVNSLIGISPHTLSLMHCLHLVDPEHRHRQNGRG
ncbi:MAG TPA: hypothetical protein VI685_26790 [Candidatus Angelobacter sp.]